MGVNLQRSYHLNNTLKNFKERTMEKKILSSSSEMKWTEKKSGGLKVVWNENEKIEFT